MKEAIHREREFKVPNISGGLPARAMRSLSEVK
jgi:hypothetical protein